MRVIASSSVWPYVVSRFEMPPHLQLDGEAWLVVLADLADIRFLVSRHRPDLGRIRQIVVGFSPPAAERATENLVYLEVLEA